MTLAERLVVDGLLRRYPACPVCGASGRRPARRRPPMQDTYMLAVAATFEVPYRELHALLDVHECERCASVYCDPWLGARGMGGLYGLGHGQHLAGWENFLRWVQQPGPPRASSLQGSIWAFLRERAAPVEVYGELNCPFEGLLPFFRDLEAGPRDKPEESARAIARIQRSYAYPESIRARLRRARARAPRLAARLLGSEAGPSARRIARVKRALMRWSYRDGSRAGDGAPTAHVPPPRRRYLLLETSSVFWTMNCNGFGATCRALCQSPAIGVPVIDWKDADREGIRFDAFGLYNCLDHFIEPAQVLRDVLARSRTVLVEGHRSGPDDTFSRQHLFALGPRFLDHVLPPGWRWEDLTTGFDDPLQNYYWIHR